MQENLKKIKVSKQTFAEIKAFGHGVPRTENRYIQKGFVVGKEYNIYEVDNCELLHVRCTQNSPIHLRVV